MFDFVVDFVLYCFEGFVGEYVGDLFVVFFLVVDV